MGCLEIRYKFTKNYNVQFNQKRESLGLSMTKGRTMVFKGLPLLIISVLVAVLGEGSDIGIHINLSVR